MTASAVLGTFHADTVREFVQEFPGWATTVETLIREGKIVIVEQRRGEPPHERDSTDPR